MSSHKFLTDHIKERRRQLRIFFVIFVAALVFLGFSPASSAQGWLDDFDPLTLPRVFARLSCYFVQFSLIIVAGVMIYSGISFLLAKGNPAGFEQAKKTFQYALLGGIIIYGVYTIIMTIGVIIGATDLSFLPLTCS